jgi:hypothetical protein
MNLSTTPYNPMATESLALSATERDLPIAMRNQLRFLYIAYYSPQLNPRMYYLANAETDRVYRGLRDFEKWGPHYNHPQVYSQFVSSHPHFYLYGDQGILQSVSDLIANGWRLRSLQTAGGQYLALLDHEAKS